MKINKKLVQIGTSLFSSLAYVSAHSNDSLDSHHMTNTPMNTGGFFLGMNLYGLVLGTLGIVVLVLLIIWISKQINEKPESGEDKK